MMGSLAFNLSTVVFCRDSLRSSFIQPKVRNYSFGDRFTQRSVKRAVRCRPPFSQARTTAAVTSALAQDVVLQFQTSTGSRRLARVLKPDGKRNWMISDSSGVHHSVTMKQVTFIIGLLDPVPQDLDKLESNCHKRAEENSELIQLVWEAICEEDGGNPTNTTDIETVSDIVFSDTMPLSLYSTYLLLSRENLFFKERRIKGELRYEARSLAQIEEMRTMQELEASREKEMKSRQNCFLMAHQECSLEPLKQVLDGTELNDVIEALKAIAIESESMGRTDSSYSFARTTAFQILRQNEKDLILEVMFASGQQIHQYTAAETLIAWGVCNPHEYFYLLQADIPHVRTQESSLESFADDLLKNKSEDVDQERRTDFSHLTAYAIDSSETTEVDDALSWDADTNRVLVHIADPTRHFPGGPSHPLIRDVLNKASTLYLPEEKFMLFPTRLGENLFSLDGVDSDGAALTFAFSLDESGALIEGSQSVEPSKIAPPLRLTYEQVEHILSRPPQNEDDEILHLLHGKAALRQKWREVEGGAICVTTPIPDIKVQNAHDVNPDIEMKVIETDTSSWTLVSEMMVTACSLCADIAAKENIPIPFRGQEPFEYPEDEILDQIPNPLVRAALIFRNVNPSRVSSSPMEHATLGLDNYTQVTSPIRRSVDLISHFQIKAFLRGDALPFSVDEIDMEIVRNMSRSRTLRQLENRRKKYWQLLYFQRLGLENDHKCTLLRVFREEENIAYVHMDAYGFSVAATVPSNARPGDKLLLKFTELKPRLGFSRAKAYFAMPNEQKDELLEILEDAFSDVSFGSDS